MEELYENLILGIFAIGICMLIMYIPAGLDRFAQWWMSTEEESEEDGDEVSSHLPNSPSS